MRELNRGRIRFTSLRRRVSPNTAHPHSPCISNSPKAAPTWPRPGRRPSAPPAAPRVDRPGILPATGGPLGLHQSRSAPDSRLRFTQCARCADARLLRRPRGFKRGPRFLLCARSRGYRDHGMKLSTWGSCFIEKKGPGSIFCSRRELRDKWCRKIDPGPFFFFRRGRARSGAAGSAASRGASP